MDLQALLQSKQLIIINTIDSNSLSMTDHYITTNMTTIWCHKACQMRKKNNSSRNENFDVYKGQKKMTRGEKIEK